MVEKYLSKLEIEKNIDEKVKTPPPKCSSFYWNNFYKYKVYIPTKNRDWYINLEEYDAYDIIRNTNLEVKDRWRLAKKNVCFALNKSSKDEEVYKVMLELMGRFMKKRRQLRRKNEKNNEFSIPPGSCKYYIFLVYGVKDIQNVDTSDRFKHAALCERVWLSNKDQKLIDFIDTTFEVIGERFANDSRRKVYCYNKSYI